MRIIITERQLRKLRENDFEVFLKNDNFKQDTINDPEKQFLFEKLDELKEEFRNFLNEPSTEGMTGNQIINAIQYGKILINNLRLVIEPEHTYGIHPGKTKNQVYLVARAYWIDWNVKKTRKFSINLNEKINLKLPRK